jgi:hypothetical protein
MSTHYLVDIFGNPISACGINDVRLATNGETEAGGSFIVRVGEGIPVRDPTDLGDLLTKKYQGILGIYAGLSTRITYDDLLDAASINTAAVGTGGKFGDRGTVALYPGGLMESTVVALTGAAPAQATVTWEAFEWVDTDSSTGRFQRTYKEATTDLVTTCEVSFNNGLNFYATTDGGFLNIPPPHQGTNFVIRITNSTPDTVIGLGSWAVIY